MSRKTVPVVALVLVLAAIGALLWLVLSPGDSGERAPAGPGAPEVDGTAATDETAPTPGRRRARRAGTGVVHGEVRLSRGETPVAGQSVALSRPGAEPWVVETDAAGAFRIAALPHGGPYEVQVAAEGYATVHLPGIALDRGEVRDVGTLWLDRAVRAEIEVRSIADAPLPGAEVRAYAAPDMRSFDWSRTLAQLGVEPIPVATATTDARGRAEFPELAAGSWTFTAAKDGFAMRGRPARQLRTDDEPAPLIIYLGRGYSLKGRVTNQDGEGIGRALLLAAPPNVAWTPQVAPLRVRALADEEGRYELTALSAGDAVIYAGRPDTPPGAVGTVRVPSVTTFDVVLSEGGVLRGAVTLASSGEPAAGAIVRASSFGGDGNTVAEAIADEQGNYVISSLAEGTVNRLSVEREGYIQALPDNAVFRPFPLRRGATVVRDLQLTAGIQLSGTVRGPSGPLAGVRLTAYHGGRQAARRSVTSDAEGGYAFDAMRPGAAVVQAELAGYFQLAFPGNWWQIVRRGENRNKVELVEGVAATLDLEMGTGSAVEGRVETVDGEPVAAARVAAAAIGRGRVGGRGLSAVSAEDGTFRIEGLAPGLPIRLGARKKGYGTVASDPVDVLAEQPTTGVVVRLAPLPTVTGRVTTLAGDPAAEAYVQLQHRGDNITVANVVDPSLFWARTERYPVRPDGTYELVVPGVEGSFTVQATAPGLPTVTSKRTVLSPDRTSYEVDLTFPAADELRGVVLAKESSEPIAGAWVRLNQQRAAMRDGVMSQVAAGPTIVAVTDQDGRFVVGSLQRGKHQVRASARGRVDMTEDVEVPRTSEVRLLLPNEMSIVGIVVLDGGGPVVGARVFARLGAAAGTARRAWSATTDGSGAFDLAGLPPGTYVLNVSPGWRGGANVLEFTSDPIAAGANDVRLVVRPGLAISGRVLDADRKPVGGAMVNANPKERRTGVRSRSVQTGPDGSFEVGGLVEGAYTVAVNPAGVGGGQYQATRLEDVVAGATGIEIVLQKGLSIEGVLLDDDGRPIASAWISVQAIGDGARNVPGLNTNADERGRFTIGGLQPGRYRLNARTFGADGMTQLVLQGGGEVTAGATGLRVTALTGASLAGVVVDENGEPVNRARITATPEGGAPRSSHSGADGRFEVRGLPSGAPVSVRATAAGFLAHEPIERNPGDTNLRIELSRGLSAEGLVLDVEGKPMKSTLVVLRQGSVRVNARTDGAGRFNAQGLQPGTYEAVVMVPDPAGGRRQVAEPVGTLRAGETGVTLQVR